MIVYIETKRFVDRQGYFYDRRARHRYYLLNVSIRDLMVVERD